jgi:hypothetical protein
MSTGVIVILVFYLVEFVRVQPRKGDCATAGRPRPSPRLFADTSYVGSRETVIPVEDDIESIEGIVLLDRVEQTLPADGLVVRVLPFDPVNLDVQSRSLVQTGCRRFRGGPPVEFTEMDIRVFEVVVAVDVCPCNRTLNIMNSGLFGDYFVAFDSIPS